MRELEVQIRREAMICAVLSFPVVILAAVGLDVTLVVVSLYPRATYFIELENVMPAYYAYRTLVEVVLEAVPQVRCRHCDVVVTTLVSVWAVECLQTLQVHRFEHLLRAAITSSTRVQGEATDLGARGICWKLCMIVSCCPEYGSNAW